MKKEKEDFRKRLAEVIKQKRQTWWRDNLNLSQSAVSRWSQGSFPVSDKLQDILRIADVNANWVLFGIGPKRLSDLDERETERMQDQGRRVHVKMFKMASENQKLKEKVKELERQISQNSIDWLFKEVDKKDAEDGEKEKVFKYNIFPVLALMRQINDISYKVLEEYAKNEIDDEKYRRIARYIKKNSLKNNLDLKKMLVELDEIVT